MYSCDSNESVLHLINVNFQPVLHIYLKGHSRLHGKDRLFIVALGSSSLSCFTFVKEETKLPTVHAVISREDLRDRIA